jgi:hypothetical protein
MYCQFSAARMPPLTTIFQFQDFIGGNSDVQALKGKKLNDLLKAPKKTAAEHKA